MEYNNYKGHSHKGKKIGDILLEKKYIKNAHLEEALKKQSEANSDYYGKKIGDILISLGYVSQKQIAECLSIQKLNNILIKYCIKYGKKFENKTPKDMYWDIMSSIENDNDEEIFMNEIAPVLNIEKYNSNLKYKIDYNLLHKVGMVKKNIDNRNMYIPIIIDGYNYYKCLTANPYVDISIYASIILTPRTVLLKILNSIINKENKDNDQDYSKQILNIDSIDIEKYLQKILEMAMAEGVSDVHIEWNSLRSRSEIKYRKDGLLQVSEIVSSIDFHERLVNKIFELSKINTSNFLKIHDERMTLESMGKKLPIRVSALPVTKNKEGEKISNIVLRLLYDKTSGIASDETSLLSLGYSSFAVKEICNFIKMPFGMIILCGPTGSGKTTTLYSMLKIKKNEPVKIVTIEDPVETTISGLTQVSVDHSNDISFLTASRAFLRHDPDVILIGEIRDIETATEACNMAMTGHLVFATLHANTASAVIPRLTGIGVDRQILASTLKVIIAQRLVRRLCDKCKIKIYYKDLENTQSIKEIIGTDDIENYKNEYKHIFVDASGDEKKHGVYYANPAGCLSCKSTGYQGRTVVWEILKNSINIQSLIVDEKALLSESVLFSEQESSMFKNIAIDKIRDGQTTISEIERFIPLSKTISVLY